MSEKTAYTASQQAAIDQQGNNLLVSASAGSGKTTVLIERIMRKIKAGTDIDQLLVVTFTNLAAKHMKQKLEKRLNAELSTFLAAHPKATMASPELQPLRRQLNLLGVANISTLDAFCNRLIQRYYYVINLDPVFRLLTDNTEGLLIRDQVWDTVREKLYEDDGEVFALLTANFSNDRSDDGLSRLIMRLYDFAQSTPDPVAWLQQLPATYHLDGDHVTTSSFYQQQVLPQLMPLFQNMLTTIQQGLVQAEANELKPATIKNLESAQAELTELVANVATMDWNALRAVCQNFKIGTIAKKYKDDVTRTMVGTAINTQVAEVKKTMSKLADDYFMSDEQQVLDIMTGAEALVTELVKATLAFKDAFAAEKRRRHVLDFNDLEHLSLQILTSQNESGQAALAQLQAQFSEVMVDEYQDINSLQENILQLLSQSTPGNMFMVGDVKQSIYQFRLADPLLFLHKYQDFGANPEHGDRIVLAENFRSVENVDQLTNLIFSQIMDAPVGQIDYDQAAYLKYGPKDYPSDLPQTTSLMLYQSGEAATEDDASDEADFAIDDPALGSIMMVAQKILTLKAEDHPIYDRATQTYRPLRYSDVALLVPTRNHNLSIVDVFKRLHIPIVVNDAQNYFQTTEIRIMMALLTIIDNPYQDIPLVAVLRSPMVGLDENQLVYLRIQNKTSDYFQALRDFYERYPGQAHDAYGDAVYDKIDRFMTQLTEFRDLARRNQLVTLIWRIYDRTGFLDYVGGMPAGPQRQANLHALYERAHAYEEGSFKGLFQFVRFIKRMQEKDEDLASAVAETSTEAVSVMTIHGSKGLEFPVVFIMDLDKRFNQTDLNASALLDRQAGIGITYLDPETRVKYPTLPRLVARQVAGKKLRAEEMRKLYVAITRAEQQLYLVGTVKDIETATQQWRRTFSTPERLLPATLRVAANNALDWVGMSLIRHVDFKDYWDGDQPQMQFTTADARVTIELGDATTIETAAAESTATANQSAVEQVEADVTVDIDDMTRQQISRILNFSYPAQVATTTTAYQSVSEVKRFFEDPDTPLMNENPTVSTKQSRVHNRYVADSLTLPKFLQTTQAPTGAEIGSATHLVLEQLDIHKPVTTEAVQATIADLVAKQVLTSAIGDQIQIEPILSFYDSTLGQQLLAQPDQVHREVPFSLLLPAQALFDGFEADGNSKILIHGIIDGYLQTDEALILFDYKTDHVAHADDLLGKYAGQVKLYGAALQSMLQRPVTQQYLYSLGHHELVAVK